MCSLCVLKEDGGRGSAELVAAVEAGDLEDEEVTHNLALELGDEVGSSLGRTTWGSLVKAVEHGRPRGAITGSDNVINDENLLALTDGVLLHLEKVLAVLLDVLGGDAGTGELALLADGSKGDTEAESEAGAEEEATGVETDNDVGLLAGKGLGNLELEGVDEGGVGLGVGKERHDVDKVNAGDGEVGELAQVVAKGYLCTGELGGGGGGGGGLSSRGILGG